jgi:hypothetical protein
MTKLNNSPEAIAKRETLAKALKTNLAKRKTLAKQQAKLATANQNAALVKKLDPEPD